MIGATTGSARFAAIDIGTNSVLLLVVEVSDGKLVPLRDEAVVTRLGRGVDQTRRLEQEAMRRTLDCLSSYADQLARFDVQSLAVVGTSALRDASGSESFLTQAERLLGTRPRIVSGGEEAELAFRGAVSGLPLEGPVTVFDVGGGSTEIIAGSTHSGVPSIARAKSIDIGAVRLHERHVRHDPVHPDELFALRQEARGQLADAMPYRNHRIVGVAGTVTTLLAMTRRIAPYDGTLVHGATLHRHDVEHWLDFLAQKNLAERRSIAGLEPRRADVILAGTAIVLEILDWFQVDSAIVSDRGLRWGLVEKAAGLVTAKDAT